MAMEASPGSHASHTLSLRILEASGDADIITASIADYHKAIHAASCHIYALTMHPGQHGASATGLIQLQARQRRSKIAYCYLIPMHNVIIHQR